MSAPHPPRSDAQTPAPALWPTAREWRWLALVLVAAFALRIALVLALRTYNVPAKDDHFQFGAEYGRIAISLARGHGYASPYDVDGGQTTVQGTPFLPFLLSVLFRVFGEYSTSAAAAFLVLNSAVYVLTGLIVFCIGKRLYAQGVAWIAVVVFCFDPLGLWYSVNHMWDTVFQGAALMLALLLFVWLDRGFAVWKGVVAGLAAGLSAHVNPSIIVVNGALALWLLWRARGRRRAALGTVSAMVCAGALCVTPWTVRNSLVLGRLASIKPDGEIALYFGNHPGATGNFKDLREANLLYNAGEMKLYRSLGEREYLRVCRERATDFIRTQPGHYARLVAKRLVFFWLGDFWREEDWLGNLSVTLPLMQLKRVVYLLPIPFAAWGLVVALRGRWPVGPLVLQVGAYSMPYMLVYCGMLKYRVPIQGSLVLLSSVAAWQGWCWVRHCRTAGSGSDTR